MVGTTSAIAVLFMMLFPVNGVIVQVVNLLLTAVDIALVSCRAMRRACVTLTPQVPVHSACCQVPTFVSFGAKMYSSGEGEEVAIGSLMTVRLACVTIVKRAAHRRARTVLTSRRGMWWLHAWYAGVEGGPIRCVVGL